MVLSHDCGGVPFYNLEKERLQKSFHLGIVALSDDYYKTFHEELY